MECSLYARADAASRCGAKTDGSCRATTRSADEGGTRRSGTRSRIAAMRLRAGYGSLGRVEATQASGIANAATAPGPTFFATKRSTALSPMGWNSTISAARRCASTRIISKRSLTMKTCCAGGSVVSASARLTASMGTRCRETTFGGAALNASVAPVPVTETGSAAPPARNYSVSSPLGEADAKKRIAAVAAAPRVD